MYAHRHTTAVTLELKPDRGALPLPPPGVVGALLAGWLLLVAASGAAAAEGAAAGIPRTTDGKPDFSGVWQSMSGADYDFEPHAGRADAPPGAGVVEGGALPYQPWALEKRAANFAARATADHSRLSCYSLGVPRSVYYPAPFQILQRPRDLTLDRLVRRRAHDPHERDAASRRGRSASGSATRAHIGKATRSSSTSSTSMPRHGSTAPATSTARRCTSSSAGRCSTRTRSSTRRPSRTRRCSRARGRSNVVLYRHRETEVPAHRELLLHARVRRALSVPDDRSVRPTPVTRSTITHRRDPHGRNEAAAIRRASACRCSLQRRAAGRPTVARIERGEWNGPRLPDGQPDIEGHWSNTIGEPRQLHGPARRHSRRRRSRGRRRRARRSAPSSAPRRARRAASPTRPTARCRFSRGRAPSRRTCSRTSSTRPSEQYIEPLARCAPAGPYEVADVARLRDSPVSGLRRVPVRLGHAHRAPRRQAALPGLDQALERRLARPLGRQHARRRRPQQQRQSAARADGRVRERERRDRGALHLRERRRALRLRSDVHGSDGLHAAVDGHDPGEKVHRVDAAPDDWHYQTFDAAHSGSERIIEAYERTCVENNAGHGQISIVGVAP